MKIYVDADSCPAEIRNFLLKTSKRLKIEIIFAANRSIVKNTLNIKMIICQAEKDAADKYILDNINCTDIAVTRDLLFAQLLVEKGAIVLDYHGRTITKENIRNLLSVRDFTISLAENNLLSERKPWYGKKELKQFADSLDRILHQNKTQQSYS